MMMLTPDDIADRLREADFDVRGPDEIGRGEFLLVVADDDRDELERTLAALAGGYRVAVGRHEPGYEVTLTEMG